MNDPRFELGLGILLASSLSISALMRILGCNEQVAKSFKQQAVVDMTALNNAITKARMVKP